MHIFVVKIFNVNDDVSTTDGLGEEGKIVRKGTNYVVLETNDGLKELSNGFNDIELNEQKKITKTKQEKDIEDIKGTQPAKYYSKDAEGDEMSKVY